MGTIETVKYSDLATPIAEPDSTVRVCGDFKLTINHMLHIDQRLTSLHLSNWSSQR